MRILLVLLGAILLTMILTNPSQAEFETWVKNEVLLANPKHTMEDLGLEIILVRSRSYLFFSYHELTVRDNKSWAFDTYTYAAYGAWSIFLWNSNPSHSSAKSTGPVVKEDTLTPPTTKTI
ncbi:hypothetical protein [Paenibacillus mucilaginosus]|uniref:hypothetical protein n=1 Tax=Paenibacillus mucilaginosus TaxID=61624 RepID=UPI00059FA588|nr:hypothetical protein [Paenibacillus mucilaginosus]MCG7216882.1 hypothetical protein [Paenibacillus mucilaginosus]WDM30978.1 hypothetical protein KCX80_18290 [Paenibacillus mucilaginosus]